MDLLRIVGTAAELRPKLDFERGRMLPPNGRARARQEARSGQSAIACSDGDRLPPSNSSLLASLRSA